MISQKLTRLDLVGRKCRPTRNIRNDAGEGVSPETICTIINVVRGKGITIETAKCPCCGQYSWITGVSRNDLELLEDERH